MSGAALVSVQRLLGRSDPKITERRYGHLLPDFMASRGEPAPLRPRPARARAAWYSPLVQLADPSKERGRNPPRFGNDSGLFTGGV